MIWTKPDAVPTFVPTSTALDKVDGSLWPTTSQGGGVE